MTSTRLAIIIGVLLSALSYIVYFGVLHEPGSLFYGFAALVFIGCPLIAGILAGTRAQSRKPMRFFASGSLVFGASLLLFIVTYAVQPQFDRANVQLPASCDGLDGVLELPPQLSYTLPDGRAGILLAESADSAVAVTIDGARPPFASTLYLVHKSDNAIYAQLGFNSDVVMAAIDAGTLYIYNDKLGYLLDEHTGAFQKNILLIDNYGGLTETDKPIIGHSSSGNWYFETTAVISSWSTDGSVKSRPHLTLNGIARGCYVSGTTNEVTSLGP
jgi:hypothetical protein